jgi:hypothetical protein
MHHRIGDNVWLMDLDWSVRSVKYKEGVHYPLCEEILRVVEKNENFISQIKQIK